MRLGDLPGGVAHRRTSPRTRRRSCPSARSNRRWSSTTADRRARRPDRGQLTDGTRQGAGARRHPGRAARCSATTRGARAEDEPDGVPQADGGAHRRATGARSRRSATSTCMGEQQRQTPPERALLAAIRRSPSCRRRARCPARPARRRRRADRSCRCRRRRSAVPGAPATRRAEKRRRRGAPVSMPARRPRRSRRPQLRAADPLRVRAARTACSRSRDEGDAVVVLLRPDATVEGIAELRRVLQRPLVTRAVDAERFAAELARAYNQGGAALAIERGARARGRPRAADAGPAGRPKTCSTAARRRR